MNIGTIIQARMSSRRLPGKVLMQVAQKPLLQYLLERVRRSRLVPKVVIATSTDRSDDPIADFAQTHGVNCFRGSLHNVAGRFRDAAARLELDAFVRVSGDSPLLDPEIIDHAVRLYLKQDPDVVTNVLDRTFPHGESVEIIRASTFQKALPLMNTDDHFEHVTSYFYEHPTDFTLHNFKADGHFGDVRFVIDTEADLITFEDVVSRMTKPQWEYGWKDLLQLYKEAASWLKLSLG